MKKRSLLLPLTAAFATSMAFAGSNPQTVITDQTIITTDTNWSGEVYLEGYCFVGDDPNTPAVESATLTIAPGTIIRGEPRSGPVNNPANVPGLLCIMQEGSIIAEGTATNPIIFTTGAIDNDDNGIADESAGYKLGWTSTSDTFLDDDPLNSPLAPLNKAGGPNLSLWGGVVILGNAPTNIGSVDAQLEYGEGLIEGIPQGAAVKAQAAYGGVNPHDNSGVLKYVSIRHGGDEISLDNEINGLTIAGVGDGTVIENIEVYCNFDDGFEWFGGTVGGKNLAAFFVGDDSFDIDQGYQGVLQFLFTIQPFFNQDNGDSYGSKSGNSIGEWDGDDFDKSTNTRYAVDLLSNETSHAWPLSYPIIYNLTGIGVETENPEFTPTSAASITGNSNGLNMKAHFAGEMWNSIILNTTGEGLVVDDSSKDPGNWNSSADNAAAGYLKIGASIFQDVAETLTADDQVALNNGTGYVMGTTAPTSGVESFINSDLTAFSIPQFALNNEDQSFDPTGNANGKLNGVKVTPVDPRYNSASLYGTAVMAHGEALVKQVTYRGAFSTNANVNLWTTGWSALNKGGILVD